MILILEGPDGAGKTTLARSFVGADIHREGPPPLVDSLVDSLVDYYADLLLEAARTGRPTVFDRLAMSEVVYGPVARGVSLIDNHQFKWFEREAAKCGATTIVCLPPYANCLAAWANRMAKGKELLETITQFSAVYDAYQKLAKGRLTYDWTKP